MEGKRQTIAYFQWIRAIGAVAIVLLHAFISLSLAPNFEMPVLRAQVEEGISIVATRWVVPAFFMVSGALMLDPKRSMGWQKTLKHVWRLGFVLLTFGFAFCVVEAYDATHEVSRELFINSVHNLFRQQSWDHMWFVYELLGYYLMTPFIRPWVAQASKEEYGRVVLVACLLLFVTRSISAIVNYVVYYGVTVPNNFAYYLLGHYVHQYLELDKRWIALGLLSLVVTMALRLGRDTIWVTDPKRGVVALYAVMIMLLFKRYATAPIESCPPMALLADYSFGIYLIHPVFQHLLVRFAGVAFWPAVAADLTMVVVPLLLSVASVWLLRFVPGFKGKI